MHRVTQLPAIPHRPAQAHKGSFGKVLIVAGSRGMTGAAALAGWGALRGGAGLVFVATPVSVQPIVAAMEACYLTLPLPENSAGRLGRAARDEVLRLSVDQDVVAIGPGLGVDRGVDKTIEAVYARLTQPVVIDADGLNSLARHPDQLGRHAGPRVLTPHPGEFSRLTSLPIAEVQARREELAAEFAVRHGIVLLLKGAGTVVTDGERLAINPTGNSGLATGGSGDVLTGLIAALLAQGLSAFDAAQLGAWMHGRAGDLAAAQLSQPALIASDLPRYLGAVWLELSATTG
jgi:NAD(P)H-hydrate epimerase